MSENLICMLILIFIGWTVMIYRIGFSCGRDESVIDDIKALDYDRIKEENIELLKTINTIDDVKHNRYRKF